MLKCLYKSARVQTFVLNWFLQSNSRQVIRKTQINYCKNIPTVVETPGNNQLIPLKVDHFKNLLSEYLNLLSLLNTYESCIIKTKRRTMDYSGVMFIPFLGYLKMKFDQSCAACLNLSKDH